MGAQGMVIDDRARVLLVRHGHRPGWHFPGGGVEKNETVRETLRRELLEETGVVIEGPAEFVGLYANFKNFPSDHIALFAVRDWSQKTIPEPNMEIAEQGFFAIDALPPGTTSGTRARIAEYFSAAPPACSWEPLHTDAGN